MRLCLHAGYSASKIEKNNIWELEINRLDNTPLIDSGQFITKHTDPVPVFCLTVSSGVFYVRRNGKGCWTGNSRARGPMQNLVRQPNEGRNRDGALRFGEMERDVQISHGTMFHLREKLFLNSDKYNVTVCDKCGIFATDNHKTGVSYCRNCIDFKIVRIQLPYACKLLFQELMAMQITPRIHVNSKGK